MASTIHLKIYSPEKVVLEKEVASIVLPGSGGSFGIYRDHANIVSKLKKGMVNFKSENGDENIEIEGGFFYFDHNEATVLADGI